MGLFYACKLCYLVDLFENGSIMARKKKDLTDEVLETLYFTK